MMPFLANKSDCTACSACQASCPVQCITMRADERGFLYPVIDETKCLQCRRCEQVCPAFHTPQSVKDIKNPLAFAAITNDKTIWKNSSSGGAFSEICRAWGEKDPANTWVFGATFEDLQVVHKGALIEHISLFYKSKYVQSRMDKCFVQIKKLLEQNKRVVFSGTPCQVAGLRNFLGKDYPGLLCIDLICHGVGSPAVFERYLTEHTRTIGKKIASYMFRAKHSLWGNYPRHYSKVTYQDGSVRYYLEDNYNKLFLNQLCLRESCGEHCKYRHINRYGDFTIADFNNFIVLFPDVKDGRAHSTLICNSSKGKELLPALQRTSVLLPCAIETISKYNPLLVRTTPENPKRAACLADFAEGMSIAQLVDKYVEKPPFSVRAWIKKHIPFVVKHFIFRMYKKLCK